MGDAAHSATHGVTARLEREELGGSASKAAFKPAAIFSAGGQLRGVVVAAPELLAQWASAGALGRGQ